MRILKLLVLCLFCYSCTPVDCIEPGSVGRAVISSPDLEQEFDVLVGEAWSARNPRDGDYSCMGRCGVGCTQNWYDEEGGVWLQSCLNQDVCSFFYESKLSVFDPNCGDEKIDAIKDTIRYSIAGCK